MSHYGDQYQAEQEGKAEREKVNLYYSNKVQGIQMVGEVISLELGKEKTNKVKLQHMFSQTACLSEVE